MKFVYVPPPDERYCIVCGAVIKRAVRDSGNMESVQDFNKRRACTTQPCCTEAKKHPVSPPPISLCHQALNWFNFTRIL
jgi:hypothetical protein